ncbi:MAG: plastocyanin/azurin family copper-binding protein [Gemmatimonadales bacterium]|jgi:plastocyanin
MRTLPAVLVVVALAACSTESSGGPTLPPSDVIIVAGAATKGAAAYDPDSITVSLAAHPRVIWANDDGLRHTVTADSGAFDSGSISSGEAYSHTFSATGTYSYHCAIHPSMVGTLVVTP